jgi:hypothetical protein
MVEENEFRSNWRYVTSASMLIRHLRDGYVAPSGLNSTIKQIEDPNFQAGFRVPLLRGTQIRYQALQHFDSGSEIGFPVSIEFTEFAESTGGLAPQKQDILYQRRVFPLTSGQYRVGFPNLMSLEKFVNWMNDSELRPFLHKDSHFFVDFDLVRECHPPDLYTPQIESDKELAPQGLLEFFENEERMQCAVEMVLGVARTREQLGLAAGVIGEDTPVGETNTEILSRSFSKFLLQTPGDESFIKVFCVQLLKMESPMRLGPLNLVEKSELIEKTMKILGPSNPNTTFFENLLHHVRVDLGLSMIDASILTPDLQGLVIFLGNNSSLDEVLKLTPETFPDLDPLAISVCAFFTGLRWRRTKFPSSSHFNPLRNAHISQCISIPLDDTNGYRRRKIEVKILSNGIEIEGEVFTPPIEMYVWRFQPNVKVLVKSGRTTQSLVGVGFIAVGNRKDIKSAKFVKILRPKLGNESSILNSINFTKKKSGFVLNLFSNRLIDKHLEERSGLEIKCSESLYFDSKEGTIKMVRPVVTIVDFEPTSIKEGHKMTLITKVRNVFSREKILLPAE